MNTLARRVAAHGALAVIAAGMFVAVLAIDLITQLAEPILTGAIEADLGD